MHEMSLAMAAIDLAAEQATQRGFNKVTTLWLEVGSFSCVDPDTIAFCFEAAAKGTSVEGPSCTFSTRRQRPGVTTATRRSPSPSAGRPAPSVADTNYESRRVIACASPTSR